jgi:sRNA-binding protein
VEEIHFCWNNVKAFDPHPFLKASNSTPLKAGLFNDKVGNVIKALEFLEKQPGITAM